VSYEEESNGREGEFVSNDNTYMMCVCLHVCVYVYVCVCVYVCVYTSGTGTSGSPTQARCGNVYMYLSLSPLSFSHSLSHFLSLYLSLHVCMCECVCVHRPG
jgi:hypothetical protein